MTTRILVIDEDPSLRECLELEFAAERHLIVVASSAVQAFARIDEFPIDLVFADIALPGLDGLELLPQLAQRLPDVALIAVTSGDPGAQIEPSVTRCAYDVIARPIEPDVLSPVLRRASERERLLRRNDLLRRDIRRATGDRPIIAASEPMIELLEEMERVAGFKTCVLLVGESGTGKEGLARAIHAQSPRRHQPFVALHCGSTPEAVLEGRLWGQPLGAGTGTGTERTRRGLVAEADGGTLFLDEIGGLSTETQTKVLQIVKEEEFQPIGESKSRRIDVRVIAASSRDLAADAAVGRFLPELHARISAHRLNVPPLRTRRKDIPLLFDHYLAHFRNSLGKPVHSIADDALERIVQHSWPGNNRELQNLVERAVMRAEGTRIAVKDLSRDLLNDPVEPSDGGRNHDFALKRARKAFEATFIRRALRATNGNRTHAAKLLDISHRALLYKIKEFRIRDLPPVSNR
jgi:two-component system response regulator AtoC